MQSTISIYDNSGMIVRVVSCPSDMVNAQLASGESFLEGTFDSSVYYVKDGVVVARPDNPSLLSGMQLTAVPVPTKLQINSSFYDVTESVVDLDITLAGAYFINLNSWPYLSKSFTINK